VGRLRLEAHEGLDRAGGPALGACLQPPPHGWSAMVDELGVGLGAKAGVVDDLRPHRSEDAVAPRGARAHGDQRVHVHAEAVAERPPGRDVEALAGPELDERRGKGQFLGDPSATAAAARA